MRLFAYGRLVHAGYVLAREGAFSLVDANGLPAGARFGISMLRLVERRSVRKTGRVERLTRGLNRLGPTYVKFGQMLGTRPDIVGALIAKDLSALQDRMPPFDATLVPDMLRDAFGDKAARLTDLSAPIAAASIAQVHQAVLQNADGSTRTIAVKILRPKVDVRFRRDLASFYAGAQLVEALIPATRRLRPVRVVKTLEQSARLELDLRFEAAAISEFTENIKDDDGFEVPEVVWDYVASHVLTTSWVEGVPIRDNASLDSAGIDRKKLAAHLMQSFLRHAIRDGFFHADMHPGNLFANPKTHGVIAVDFGIMGRISPQERKFLAEILLGFITRDYAKIARRHFEIGYVPASHSMDDFALALRAIGEPLHGRPSRDISMARVFGQLLSVTDLFDMQARPELLLLQKTMVLVEGVSRALDPDLNIWDVSEPVVRDWLEGQAGPRGQLETLAENAKNFMVVMAQFPDIAMRVNTLLDEYEAERLNHKESRANWFNWGVFGILAALAALLVWRVM